MPDIKPIKPTETDERTNRTRVIPIILIIIGITASLMSSFILVFVGAKGDGLDVGDVLFKPFAYVELLVGFILFTVGLHSYARNGINRLSSLGWWIFTIATWLEVFFIGAYIKWGDICYGSYQNCVHRINVIPHCLVPVVFMLFGLVLVHLGKKKRLNKPVSEEQEKPKQDQPVAVQRGLRWGPIFAVALLIMALQIVTNWIILCVGPGYGHGTSYTNFMVASILIAILCCGCGGFVVGAIAGYRGATHGILPALIAWSVNMIIIQGHINDFEAYISHFNGGELTFFIVLLVVSLIIAIGFGGLSGVLGARLRKRYIYN